MKKYTQNWNQEFIKNSKEIREKNLCLEIGCFEGLTSNYIVENILSERGKLICIDPLTDVYLNNKLSELDIKNNNTEFIYFKDQYSRFINNVYEHIESGKIELIRDLSINVFDSLIEKYNEGSFDFIYIDGDHRPDAVYIDAINSFKLCKIGGYILFDDYNWGDTREGIDRFLNEVNDYHVLLKDSQVLITKK